MATDTRESALALFTDNARATYDAARNAAIEIGQELEDFRITTKQEEARVNELLAAVKVAAGNLEHARTGLVKPLNDRVKAINDVFRRPKETLEKLEAIAKRKLTSWLQQERERIAREQEEARRKQEEAQRIALEAEQKRQEAERQRQEQLRRAEEAKNSKAREVALAKAREAEEQAAAARAQETQATSAIIAAREAEPMPAPTGIKTDSATTGLVEHWTFRVVDKTKVPTDFLVVSEVAVRRAIAQGARHIEGLEIYAEEGVATRLRR